MLDTDLGRKYLLARMATALPIVDPMTPAEFRRLRNELGLSQERLALVLGKVGSTINNWESDDRDIDPTAALAIRKLVEDAKLARKRAPRDGSSPVAKPSRKSPKS